MHTVALFGAGKIGEAITGLLTTSGRYKVKVCDISLDRAKLVAGMWSGSEPHQLTLTNKSETLGLMKDCAAVITALPYYCNVDVAALCASANVNYFDLTEDVSTSKQIAELSKNSQIAFMPQCGLAPGFISIAAAHLIRSFEKVDTVKMRVGALPIYPSNRLKYNLTWSTEGLINEYGNLCEMLEDGKKINVLPLEGYEHFSMDGVEYEAFNTSGGLGTLCDTMEKQVRTLDYKSVRYPGHRELVAFLMQDLRFNQDRDTLRQVFERSISTTAQDKCLIFVEVRGYNKNRYVQRTYASTVYNTMVDKHHFGAIQITTAAGICAPVDMYLNGKLSKKGLLKSEDIPLLDFLDNEFGKYYRDDRALMGISV